MDALLPGSKDPAKLKFRTLFNGLTIGPLLKKGTSQCDRTISGTDALTGFDLTTDIKSFFGAHAYPIIHNYIEHTALISGAAINDDVTSLVDPHITTTTPNSILSSAPGAKDLKFTQLTRNSAVGAGSILPQCFFTIEAPGAATRYEPNEYYVSFIFQLPDLNTILTVPNDGGHWWAFFDYKHDGYLSQQYGDYRLISQIIKGADGNLYWNTRADNLANGGGIVPSVGPSMVKYWESNVTTGVDLETPLLFECYVRRPQKIWTRSSTTESGASGPKYQKDLVTGITKVGVTNLSTGVFTTLANQIGGEQMGNENLVLGRAFHGFYSATADNVSYLTDLQFWDSIPAHSRLSKRYTYNRAKFYAPLTSTTTLSKGTGSPTFTRTTACWEYIDGVLTQISSGNPRIRSDRGIGINPNQTINTLRYCRDLTQSQVWKVSGYGANLVSNGSFDSGVSGWTGSGTAVVTHSSGQLSLQMVGGSDTAYTAISCTVGVRYVVQVSVASGMGSARYLIGTTAGGSQVGIVGQPTSGAAETFFSVFTATATTHYISLTVNTAATRLFDNVSVYAAGVTTALNQTGLDNVTNSCTLLTAAINDATISQTITAAAAAGCSGFKVKRSVGTGPIYFSRDGGTSWLDITSEINASDFSLVKIENTSVTNPQIMFKIATSGDAIIVDAGINHLGTKIASCPILTTSASVTVNAETLTYPTTYNIETSQGTILATFTADSYSSGMGNIVGSSTAGLATSSSYTCQAKDGTNTVNGSAASPSGTIKIGMAWDANLGTMYAIGENGIETSGTYDGSLGLSTIAILPSVDGYIKDVACFNIVLANSEVQSVFNS